MSHWLLERRNVLVIDDCILAVAHCFIVLVDAKLSRSAVSVHDIGTSMMKLAIGVSGISISQRCRKSEGAIHIASVIEGAGTIIIAGIITSPACRTVMRANVVRHHRANHRQPLGTVTSVVEEVFR